MLFSFNQFSVHKMSCGCECDSPVIRNCNAFAQNDHSLLSEKDKKLTVFKELMHSMQGLIEGTNESLLYENANKDGAQSGTQRDLLAGEISKMYIYYKDDIIPPQVKDAIAKNQIKFHDQDYFLQKTHNCCIVNLSDMLDNGTVINQKMIDSPTNFPVACTVTTQIIAAVSSGQYGGTSISATPLAKYLRKSYNRSLARFKNQDIAKAMMTVDLESGVQTLNYQLNTLSTANGQCPFSTMFLHIEDNSEYEAELAMIVEEVFKQRIKGIKDMSGHYTSFAFPKLIYVLDENNANPDSKYYYLTELAAQCTAQRMVPDYISAKIMRECYEGNVFPPMGCRSFLSPYKDANGKYKFDGRCNIGVVTLNIPQIAICAKGNMNEFWRLFNERMDIVKDALLARFRRFSEATSDISPIHYQHGAMARLPPGTKLGDMMKNGYATLAVGYIGIYEACKLMTRQSQTQPEGLKFGLQILQEMKRLCIQWRQEHDIQFSLFGTPSEATAGALCEKDAKLFGLIKNVTDKGWYTNSFHVDVRERVSAFEKLRIESQFQRLSLGGTISYVEVPNLTKNNQAMMDLIKFMYDNIMYSEMNTKSDFCRSCSYDGEILLDEKFKWYCPQCGERRESMLNVVRRTCGYIGENFWNVGKTKEIKDRVCHLDVPIERGIVDLDPSNGDGLRVSVWFQGCPHACKGCHNEHLWKYDGNFQLNIDKIVELCQSRKKLSILGGEPLAPYNRKECARLIQVVRAAVPDCSIYLWTGYEIAELNQMGDRYVKMVMENLDKVIAGRFIQELRVPNDWYGSSNQQIIEKQDVMTTLQDW